MIIELKITMNEAGGISVSGPIENPVLCYGLLVMAKDVIAAHLAEAARRVQPAPAHALSLLAPNGKAM